MKIGNGNRDLAITDANKITRNFSFSRIYKGETLEIFNDEMENVLKEESAYCFIAYGPTNSGKTYTIWGIKILII